MNATTKPTRNKPATLDAVCTLRDHDRARVSWILRPAIVDGAPAIVTVARIIEVLPRDGAGRARYAVTDWGMDGRAAEPVSYVTSAAGYGYDKRAACLAGCTVGGIELGDHCDHAGRPTLDEAIRAHGLAFVGDGVSGNIR